PTPSGPEPAAVPQSGVVPLGSLSTHSRSSPVPPPGPVTITESTPPRGTSPSTRPDPIGIGAPSGPRLSRPPESYFGAAASSRPPPSANNFFHIAEARLAARDLEGARDACQRGLRVDPTHNDCLVLAAWVRASLPNGDARVSALELDQILAVNERHLKARY